MRFYTTTQNTRKKQVGVGSHKGQSTHVCGWNSGVRVESFIADGVDTFHVFLTSGTNKSAPDVFLGAHNGNGFKLNKGKAKTK